MTFIARKDAPKEEQIAEAAAYAGVPAAVIDGIWRVETNRGQHATMVGPDTKWGKAKGHFQQLDGITKEWSKRVGKELDPFDFSDGLTMVAHQLKENMGMYKGSVDKAVLAYHGGTNQENWGDKTHAYLEKVTGQSLPAEAGSLTSGNLPPTRARTVGMPDGDGKKPHMSAEEIWTADDAAVGILDGGNKDDYLGRAFDIRADSGEMLKARNAEYALVVAKQTEIDNRTFFGDVVPAAYRATMNPIFRVMSQMSSDAGEYAVDPEFMQEQRDNWAKSVKGYREPHEQEYLLNAVNRGDRARREFHLEEQKRALQIVAEDGVRGMGAMFLAQAADPTTYIVGIGAMKGMYLLGRGAHMLAQQGRVGAAIGSAVVENAAGGVAYEAMLQAFGEHRTAEDYAIASVMGLLPAGISAPGLYRTAVNEAARKHLANHTKKVLEAERVAMEQVAKDLGEGATPTEIMAEVDRRKAAELAREVDAIRGRGQVTDRAVKVQDPNDPEFIKEVERETEAAQSTAATEAEATVTEQQPAAPGSLPRQDVGKADGWLNVSAQDDRNRADKLGITGKIEDLFAQGLTVAQVKTALRAELDLIPHEDRTGLIVNVRATLGIPSQMDADGKGEFKAWKENYDKRKQKASPAEQGTADAVEPVDSTMTWRKDTAEKAPGGRTYRQFLDEAVADTTNPVLQKAATMLRDLADPQVWDMPTKLSGNARENVRQDGMVTMRNDSSTFAKVHEAVHVATIRPIEQWLQGLSYTLGADTRAAVRKLDALLREVRSDWEVSNGRKVGEDSPDHVEYALKDLHEFAAQALSSAEFQAYLASKPSANGKTMYREFLEAVARMLGINVEGTKLDEVTAALEQLLSARDTIYRDATGAAVAYAPKKAVAVDPIDIKYGLDTLPADSPIERAKKKAIRELYRQAEAWVEKNPRNDVAINNAIVDSMAKVGMALPATLLAKSDNPIARWVSATLLEQTTHAHGASPNAAIAAHVLAQEYTGRFVNTFNNLYAMHRNERMGLVKGTWDDILEGNLRTEFNVQVAAEVESRLLGYPTKASKQVTEAADAVEFQMELMRKEQIDNKTPGFGAMPETSRGHMPHLLDAAKVASMSLDMRRAYISALADQFKDGLEDMSDDFAERVARNYIKHATDRRHGLSDIPADPLNHGAAGYILEAMKAADMDYAEIRAMEHKLNRGAASHTKRRLKMDTLKEYTAADGTRFRMLDLFRTDMIDLVRGQARRVAGDVALTRFGVQGSAGLDLIKEAISIGPHKLTADQIKAMKQTFSELLGRPIDLTQESQVLNGLMTYSSLTKLGGMGFTQVGEYHQFLWHVGLQGTFDALTSFPRLLGEVRALARGEKVENGILGSMEFRGGGGEFGTEGYYISPYDTTGREFEAYGQSTAGPLTRVLKKAQYGMGIVSFHRAIQAGQQRGAAEQVTLKVLRLVKEGKAMDKAMVDMGFTQEVADELTKHIDTAVEWNGGRVKTFDITKLPSDLQEKFHQGVRRGVYQIIQGTFIGERGHWNHSQLGRLLTQFRNYSLTSMEKQLARNMTMHGGGVRGALVAGGMIVASAGMVLPVYAARVAFNAATREDKDEYIDRMMSPEAVLRNVMNYIAMVGLMPDLLDGLFAIAGGIGEETGLMEGAENRYGGQVSLGTIIPAVGSIEQLMRAPENVSDPHKMLRLLPYSNTPMLVPFIEALRGD